MNDQSAVQQRILFVILVLGALVVAAPALAARSPDGLWSDIAFNQIPTRGTRVTVPDRYRSVRVDLTLLEATLRSAPPEGLAGGVPLRLPMPDGSFQTFMVKNSPIMAPQLAKQFPDISTYVAVAQDNPGQPLRRRLQ